MDLKAINPRGQSPLQQTQRNVYIGGFSQASKMPSPKLQKASELTNLKVVKDNLKKKKVTFNSPQALKKEKIC